MTGLYYPPLPKEPWLRPPRWLLVQVVLPVTIVLALASGIWVAELEGPIRFAGVLIVLGPLAWFAQWAKKQARALDVAWERADALEAQGDDRAAIEALQDCARHRRVPRSHALSLFQLACCHLRLGENARALELYASFHRHPGRDKTGYAAWAAGQIAILLILQGRVAEAELWLAESENPKYRPDLDDAEVRAYARQLMRERLQPWEPPTGQPLRN